MKTYKHLYPEVCSFQNLLRAYRKARRGKRLKPAVAEFDIDLEKNLFQLRDELRRMMYEPGEYRDFIVHEPKERLISAAPFRDRVVHHAVCNVIEPIFERSFIFDSYACRKGKGTHKAIERCQSFLMRNRYVLKCDVRKFFPSIDHEVLLALVQRKIADVDLLVLLEKVIRSKVFREEIEYLDLLDMFNHEVRYKGIPIGNLTSQFFANVYLNGLDQFMKHGLRTRYYIRYMDDFLVFSDDKAYLHWVKERAREYLRSLKLEMHPKKCTVFPTATGVDFLGFRLYRSYRRIRKSNIKLFIRRLKRMRWLYGRGEMELDKIGQSVQSWVAHARHAKSDGLRTSLFNRFSFVRG